MTAYDKQMNSFRVMNADRSLTKQMTGKLTARDPSTRAHHGNGDRGARRRHKAAGVGQLRQREMVNLGLNQLSGEMPPCLGNLLNLRLLALGGNQLSGCVPSSLIDRLDIDYSDLEGLRFCP